MAASDDEIWSNECSGAGQFPGILMKRVLTKYFHAPNAIEGVVVNNIDFFELKLVFDKQFLTFFDVDFITSAFFLFKFKFGHSVNRIGLVYLEEGRNRFQALPFWAAPLIFCISFDAIPLILPITARTLWFHEYFLAQVFSSSHEHLYHLIFLTHSDC